MIRETARRIAAERLAPIAEKLDRGEGRDELLANLKLLAENGFMALNVKAAYGGTEAGSVAFALAIEEIGYACAATGVATSVTNMVGEVIQAVGSEAQRRAYLPRLPDRERRRLRSGRHDDARPARRRGLGDRRREALYLERRVRRAVRRLGRHRRER